MDPDPEKMAGLIFTKLPTYVAPMARTNIFDFGDDSDPDQSEIFCFLYCTKYRISFNEI